MERIILFQADKTTENQIRRLTSAKKYHLLYWNVIMQQEQWQN